MWQLTWATFTDRAHPYLSFHVVMVFGKSPSALCNVFLGPYAYGDLSGVK